MRWSKKYPCKEQDMIIRPYAVVQRLYGVVRTALVPRGWFRRSLSRFSFHVASRITLLPQDGMLIHGWFITGSLPLTQNFAVPIWPLTDMTDQDWISPYNINQTDDENKRDYELILYQIVWIEQQTVRWITDEILRMKGLNSWVEKDNVFYPRTQDNDPLWSRTRTSRSGVQCTDH